MILLKDLTKYDKIVLIGADGVGKTTICRDLENNGYRYIKASVGDGTDKIKCSLDALSSIGADEKIIFDRFYFPDDLIYSKLIKGTENQLTFEDWKVVNDKLKELGFVIVYATQDIDVIKARIRSRGDEFIDESQIEQIVESYAQLIPKIAELNTVIHLDLSVVSD